MLLLLQLVLRYSAQFRQDARRLFDSERGYNADFSKTCNELIDKYLANFQEEVRPQSRDLALSGSGLVLTCRWMWVVRWFSRCTARRPVGA